MVFLYGAEGLTERKHAYRLLEEAVRLRWGLDALPELGREARGKPFFPRYPQYQFNLSHSGSYALCALSSRPVGADLQILRPSWSPRLVSRSCTSAELAWLAARGGRPEEFAALWACKESVGKYSGYGLPYPPSRLEIPLPEAGPLSPGLLRRDGLFLRTLSGPDWRGAVCAQEPPPEEILWLPLF